MEQGTIWGLVLLAALAIIVAAGVWWFFERRRREELRQRFGPEYERAVHETGNRRRAEAELEQRQKRVEQLNIHPLSNEDRARFTEAWHGVQARFVDEPSEAIVQADRLVSEVMQTRGYPMGDFEQRAADISVTHPQVVENYRSARDVALANQRGDASTEDLRQAMVRYRALFAELLQQQEAEVRR
jgi:hypothetical protein